MVEIGRTLVSIELFREFFLCDFPKCKGACCVEGDSGAPLTQGEADLICLIYPLFKVYLSEEHIQFIDNQGFSVIDLEGDLVTPLVNNRECAYSFYDEAGILKCAIERAYQEGRTDFRKPVSCHLFPLRIQSYRHYDAVNYEKVGICNPGRECGLKNKMPLYRFLKEPLIRKFGESWFRDLESVANDKNFIRKLKLMPR
jgi:Protein of unknown function (DUF3109)